MTLPWVASGRWMVSFEPDAVTICCSLVPENWPRIACVTAEGGWIVREYMNMFDVMVAMAGSREGPGQHQGIKMRVYSEKIPVKCRASPLLLENIRQQQRVPCYGL